MVERTEWTQSAYSATGSAERRQTPRVQFGSEPFPDNPSLDRTMRQLEQAVNFQSFANDHIPAEGGQFVSGTKDKPWADMQTRRLGVTGTCTMEAGVLIGRQKFVFECATNSALIIIPVYTTGSSPYDIWHPSSGYYRDGAIWLQKASPAQLKMRAMGTDRLIGIWDTTTCTEWGSALLVRNCGYKVCFTTHQFADAASLGLYVLGTSTFGTTSFQGGVSFSGTIDMVGYPILNISHADWSAGSGSNWLRVDHGTMVADKQANWPGSAEFNVDTDTVCLFRSSGEMAYKAYVAPVVRAEIGDSGGALLYPSTPSTTTVTFTIPLAEDTAAALGQDQTFSGTNTFSGSTSGIDHTELDNIGTNTHAQIDTHIADSTIHFTEGSIDHGSISGLGDDDHTIYFLASGARNMAGDINMNGNDIVNIDDIPDAPTFSEGIQGELQILSTDASNKLRLFHNNTDAFFKWDDGNLTLSTDEGTNTDTNVYVKGKGTGKGYLIVFDQDNAEYLDLHADSGYCIVSAGGSSPVSLSLQHDAAANAHFFEFTGSGVTRELSIHGYRSGDANRALAIGVGVDAADQASFDGVSNYFFDGNVKATSDFYSGGSQGVTTTFVNGDGDTVEVTGGIITAITPP